MKLNHKLLDKAREFQDYIKSEKWKLLKEKRLEKDEFKCVLCKSKEKLVCHHLTYMRLYKEEINDLITLCSRCHKRIHFICSPKVPEFAQRSLFPYLFGIEELRTLIED